MSQQVVIIDTITHRRGTAQQWEGSDRILKASEIGYDTTSRTFKMGDGFSEWDELDSYLPESAVHAAIEEALVNAGTGGGVDIAALTAHINSLTPHPAYDDGPSFALLYENAKV